MKAQSAVEYLTTYGWMLIGVSIVTGAVYSSIEQECSNQVSGLSNEVLTANQVASGQEDFNLVVENSVFDPIGVEEIIVEDDSTGEERVLLSNEVVDPGQREVLTLPMAPVDDCNTYDLRIRHNISELEGREVTGRLTVQGNLMVEPPELALFNVDY